MALPKINVPMFTLVLPSTGQKLKFRPFCVKEEKVLLLAIESENEQEIALALKQIINNCIQEPLDVDDLATFDIEYIFLQLRAKSVGETVTITFTGREGADCAECKKSKEVQVRISDLEVKKDPKHTNIVRLTDSIGITMKYPTFEAIPRMADFRSKGGKVADGALDLIYACIENIFDSTTVNDIKDEPKEAVIQFIENLTKAQFAAVMEFFDTMPTLRHTLHLKCDTCGFKQDYVIEGIKSFFV